MKSFILILLPIVLLAQPKPLPLPEGIDELSGLVFINDSVMVGHNDGGNKPRLYFLNKKGALLHTCELTNVKNNDWEDICYDGKKYLYIGDIGNNDNTRKDLQIIRVSAQKAWENKTLKADTISYSYPDQTQFPPALKDKKFDAEALAYYNDELYIFTKCRTEPWDGFSQVYKLSTELKEQKAQRLDPIYVGKNGWWQDAITAADIQGSYCYLLTYNRVMVYQIQNGQMTYAGGKILEPITQKEAIAVNSEGEIYVGDERSKMIGGGNLMKVTVKWKK